VCDREGILWVAIQALNDVEALHHEEAGIGELQDGRHLLTDQLGGGLHVIVGQEPDGVLHILRSKPHTHPTLSPSRAHTYTVTYHLRIARRTVTPPQARDEGYRLFAHSSALEKYSIENITRSVGSD
jgi:hypothetical protein